MWDSLCYKMLMAKGEKGVNRVVIGSFIMCFVTVVNQRFSYVSRSTDEVVLSHCMEVEMEQSHWVEVKMEGYY